MTKTLAVLTMGQTPRPDGLGRDIQSIVGTEVCVHERGVLDGLTDEEIASLAPRPGEYHIITLLKDRRFVQLSKKAVLQRIQEQILDLEQLSHASATLLMCTGEFPKFEHHRPLLQPQAALYGVVIGMANGERIGSLTPLASQIDQARCKWREMGVTDVILVDANPYMDDVLDQVSAGARKARETGAGILFMDCFGYDLEMRKKAQEAFQGPVLLARSLAARLAAEIVS